MYDIMLPFHTTMATVTQESRQRGWTGSVYKCTDNTMITCRHETSEIGDEKKQTVPDNGIRIGEKTSYLSQFPRPRWAGK